MFRQEELGLYVHVPFCATRCDFCAFYEETPSREKISEFFEGIKREKALLGELEKVGTIFWGGGTPGALAAKDLLYLGSLLGETVCENVSEWSIEMTPVAATAARLDALKDMGVNRISLGIQSFQDDLLVALGRRHNAKQAYRAYESVRRAGFTNVNFDMMFALPGQEEDLWLKDLREVFALAPEHISTYCLTLEEDTALWLKLGGGKTDAEREADFYDRTWICLEDAGYRQYEISNFAKPGYECMHNLNTWKMNEWIGMGPSAASQYHGERGRNIADLKQWLKYLYEGRRMTEDRMTLNDALIAEDSLVFGLRMNAGVDIFALKQRFPSLEWKRMDNVLEQLVQEGLMVSNGDRVFLSRKGRLLADAVGESILNIFEPPSGDA